MKVRFNRWYNAVLTALLSMLGFGCSSSEDQTYVPMYGAPADRFQIRGQVTDEAGTPIQGIKMSLRQTFPRSEEYGVDSVQTDASGSYLLMDRGFLLYETKLIAEDVDGEANGGEFQSDTLDIDLEKGILIDEGDGYMKGDTYESYQDIKLKKK